MHAGIANACDLRNGFRQLLLHRIVVTNLFHELTGGHGGHVFQRVHAMHFSARQTFGRQQHACFLVFVSRHHDLSGVVVDLWTEISGLEGFDGKLLVGLWQHHGQCPHLWGFHRHRCQAKGCHDHQNDHNRQYFSYRGLTHQIADHAHGIGQRRTGDRAHRRAIGHHRIVAACTCVRLSGQRVGGGAYWGIECCTCGCHGVLSG